MRILVIGTGAREHAIVRALLDDPSATEVIAAPGNAGIAADVRTVPVDQLDPEAVATLAKEVDADLVVVGPEAPLVAGVADAVRGRGIPCFGPSAAAARLEGSKSFAKEVMAAAHVPTAAARICRNQAEVLTALAEFGAPHVVKDDGLAAGKGVVVTSDAAQATAHALAVLAKTGTVLIEEYLEGPEVSLFVLTDGAAAVPLLPAQDFKRINDGDEGPNTGGMGAYAPLPWAKDDLVDRIMHDVAEPTINELGRRGSPFVGVLYCGIALTSSGPRVIEFNCRFGDPEVQAVLALLKSSLLDLLWASATGSLASAPPPLWSDESAVNVVIASQGYPEAPVTGDRIGGLDEAAGLEGVRVLHAATTLADEEVFTAGGRVLSVIGVGADVTDARRRAYDGVAAIDIRGAHFRRDIADPSAWA